ncbi:alpha/beta fold hydrolase [Pseudonocardia bannensis]|uniref:Alpha/beta hydrolase n=1 Tax=Pseudonocardia bannensis TaxID=630973 RepID=A0A848DHH1_9PSEU|nr:alpha/beta hydrolase [Pseudonocardia bannensis]NMH91999.1 alpha/beta hydrolase [Pseudonocardia bannensis]
MSTARKTRGSSLFVDCGRVRLHVLEYGAGERTLLLLPGITSPAATWEFVAERLAEEIRILTWDARGRGLSDHPETGYGVGHFAADLDALITALKLDRPAVLAHSMGARIAAYFGARRPERVGPQIIVDPPMMGPGRPPYASPMSAYIDELRKASAGELTLEELGRSWPSWDIERLRDRQQWLPTCSEAGVRESYIGLEQDDLVSSWRGLRPPLLLIRGADSPALSADDEAELRAANPDANYVSIAGAGHMVPYDNLEDFLGVVRRFLADSNGERKR